MATIALTLVVPVARADTKSQLEAAQARLARINEEVRAQRATLARLSKQTAAVAWRVQVAEGKLQQVQAELDQTRVDIADATARFQELQTRLAERARELFIQGPGAAAGFLLGATSLVDLSDRIEFSSAVARSDADLATGVANLRNRLDAQAQRQAQLTAERRSALDAFRGQLADLNADFALEKQINADIAAKRREAVRVVSGLNRKLQAELTALIPTGTTVVTGPTGGTVSIRPFEACPVGQPLALTDSFGAPRYGGGYHLHAGVDIMAPTGTPIYATFAGVAEDASNTLGGLAVRVVGSDAWTYNAHMSQIGQLGPVQAGDVIGYIGATGDTSTPHNHFEWHPNAIPSSWPASAYGYSVIDDAVNPYPVLIGVC